MQRSAQTLGPWLHLGGSYRRPPRWPFALNRDSELSLNVVGAFPLIFARDHVSPINLVTGQVALSNVSAPFRSTLTVGGTETAAVEMDGVNDYLNANGYFTNFDPEVDGICFSCWYQTDVTNANQGLVSIARSSTDLELMLSGSGQWARMRVDNSGIGAMQAQLNSYQSGTPYHQAGMYVKKTGDNPRATVWWDDRTTSVTNASANMATGTYALKIGRRSNDAHELNGRIAWVVVRTGASLTDEIVEREKYTWELYYELGRRVYFDVVAGGAPWTGTLTAASFGFTAQAQTRLAEYASVLSAASFGFSARALSRINDWIGTLSTASFGFTAQALNRLNAWVGELSAASFGFVGQALAGNFGWLGRLGAASFGFTANALTRISHTVLTLSTASFKFLAGVLFRVDADEEEAFARYMRRMAKRVKPPPGGSNQ